MIGALVGTVGTRLLLMALSFATAVLTARLLGPEGRGQYFLCVTVMTLAAQFGSLGLHSSNTLLVSRRPAALAGLVANSLLFSLAAGAASAVLAALLVGLGLLRSIGGGLVALAIVGVAPAVFSLLGSGILAGLRRFSALNRCEVLSRGLPLLLVVLSSRWPSPALFLAAAIAGSLAGGAVQVFILLGGVARPRYDHQLLTEVLRHGFRFYLVGVLAFLVPRGNILVLGHLRGAADVGQLSVASQLADVLTLIPATLGFVLFPELLRSQERWAATRRALRATAALMLALCVAAAGLAPPLVPLVFGHDYAAATGAFQWLLPGVFFLGLVSVLSQYLASVGLPWSLVAAWFAAVLSVAATSLGFVPLLGARGAAAAVSVTYAFLFGVVLLLALAARGAGPGSGAGQAGAEPGAQAA